jgi:hypothetical protein
MMNASARAPALPTMHASRLRSAAKLLPWLPAVLGGVYLVTLIARAGRLIAAVYLDADLASAPVIGELLRGSAPGRVVFLGHMPWFSTLMFELATRWLPLHREVWELAPFAMALASAVLVAWGVGRLAGRWAGAMAAVIGVCLGPSALAWLLALDDHSPTWFSFCVLGALLVLLYAPPRWLGTPVKVVLVVVVGGVVGANAASDSILPVAGLLPFVAAAAGAWWLARERAAGMAALWVFATAVVSGLSYGLTKHVMASHSIVLSPSTPQNKFASTEALVTNFKLWWQSAMTLGNGGFFGQVPGWTTDLQMVCALLAIAALVAIPLVAWRELSRGEATASAARAAWCLYWSLSAALLSLIFIFSNVPVDLSAARYIVGLVYAAAALVPLAGASSVGARRLIVAGCAILALTGITTLVDNQETAGNAAQYQVYNEVAQIAAREHLEVGYSGYWDAAPLTWSTHARLQVFPVKNCGVTLCMFELHVITSWYTQRAGQRSFLLEDTAKPPFVAPIPTLGAPTKTYTIGPLKMYIYPYDIARYVTL